MQALLTSTPKRHTHRIANPESNIRILQGVIARRQEAN
jgi:hypothetical protein